MKKKIKKIGHSLDRLHQFRRSLSVVNPSQPGAPTGTLPPALLIGWSRRMGGPPSPSACRSGRRWAAALPPPGTKRGLEGRTPRRARAKGRVAYFRGPARGSRLERPLGSWRSAGPPLQTHRARVSVREVSSCPEDQPARRGVASGAACQPVWLGAEPCGARAFKWLRTVSTSLK